MSPLRLRADPQCIELKIFRKKVFSPLDSYLGSRIIFASVNIKSALMMAQTKYKIGEFSRLGRVTVRTLRHYEKIGLLKPGIVDRWTGYRYYSPEQLQKLLSIVQLKQLGFSLAEITELYEDDTHSPDIRALESKIKACEQELQMLKDRYARLRSLVAAQKKRMNMEKIYFDTLPSITVAYNRTVLSGYDALGMHLVNVVAPEMARLGCECPEPGYCFTVETAREYKAENFEIEYCERVTSAKDDSEIVKFKTLPEYQTAICMKVYGPYSKLRESYIELFAEIAKMGYEIADAPRANYVDGIWNQEDPEKWLTVIQVPVRK